MRTLLLALACLYTVTASAATGVYVQKLTPAAFADRLEALGTLRANESVEITATVTERLLAVHFRDGQRVTRGALLAEMDAAEEEALRQEQFLVADEAARQYERVKKLAADGLAPQSQLDEKRREYLAAQARLDGIDARLRQLKLTAPFDGVLGIRTVSPGTLVKPGDVITTLDDDKVMKLDFSVPSTYLPALSVGLKIKAVARALDNAVFDGEIASIDSRVDPVTRAIRVRALVPNPDARLRPGLLMSIDLYKNPRQALMLREEALILEGRNHYVFRVNADNKIEKVNVVPGSRAPGWVEILQGLNENDLLVTQGTVKLRPGAEVKVLGEIAPGQRLPDLMKGAHSS